MRGRNLRAAFLLRSPAFGSFKGQPLGKRLRPVDHATAFRRAKINHVLQSDWGSTVWLDIEFDEPSHEQLRVTLFDAPDFIDACADTPVEMSAEFIFCHGQKWARRLNYTQARLCKP